MEELRAIRRLKKQIEAELDVEDASDLALALVNNGITEISDTIRKKYIICNRIVRMLHLIIIGLLL